MANMMDPFPSLFLWNAATEFTVVISADRRFTYVRQSRAVTVDARVLCGFANAVEYPRHLGLEGCWKKLPIGTSSLLGRI